jgi:hypothetical protein
VLLPSETFGPLIRVSIQRLWAGQLDGTHELLWCCQRAGGEAKFAEAQTGVSNGQPQSA